MTKIYWRHRGYKVLSTFFYGYGASIAPLIGVASTYSELHLSLSTILTFPLLGGFVAMFPQLGKIFAEAGNHE